MKKELNFKITILIMLAVFCGYHHSYAKTGATPFETHFSGWKLGYDNMILFKEAFKMKNDYNEYSLCSSKLPGLITNYIFKEWNFSWKNKEYTFLDSNAFIKLGRLDATIVCINKSYSIADKETGRTILEAVLNDNLDGTKSQFLIAINGKGVIVEGLDRGKRINKNFKELKLPYNLNEGILDGLEGETILKWSEFDTDSLTIEKKRAQAVKRKDNTFKISMLDNSGIEMIYDANSDRMIRVSSPQMDMNICQIETALLERSKELKELVSIEVTTDCWLPPEDDLQGLKARLIFKNKTGKQIIIEQNKRQSIEKVPGKPHEIVVSVHAEKEPSFEEINQINLIDYTKEMHRFLKPENTIQSNESEIRKTADEIIGHEKNPYYQSKLLAQWVHKNIKSTYDVLDGNALETLKTRRGDCSENAKLFVALARSIGIPSRLVSGWKGGITGFGGHEWSEVYLGKWIEIDPSTGELSSGIYIRDYVSEEFDTYRKLEQIKIEQLFYKNKMVTIDKTRPYSILNTKNYYNRFFGIAFKIPENTVSVNSKSIDSLLTLLIKKATPLKAITLSVTSSVGSFESELNNYAENHSFYGSKYTDFSSFVYNDKKVVVYELLVKESNQKFIGYYIPLKDNLGLIFTCLGEDIKKKFWSKLPPYIATMVSSLQITSPDIGKEIVIN
ncbi:transglutaminase-like domain-containing protein [Desulfobacula toluolica]|uniref:Transglutaminase domain protein n=1 Tax=Desulfobacula toluolica (strain DSM 7467 / Tol2) TaxID=651182 RepID=K0NPU8_DESTT|nr:transglutaminase-like domain-containing protein [Desulfobacula toluolica]CCK82173.1 transglutaminase domain protein [Desulfobacula toluolica Tol2]